MKPPKELLICLFLILLIKISLRQYSQDNIKQVQYLSGTDNIHTKTWDFFCTSGRNSEIWTKIEVPSCWEQKGFGTYNYGRDYHTYGRHYKYADEKGLYRHEFLVPESWNKKVVYLVFEGSMTDTEVKINGMPAGEIHQGSFYRFKYNITDKLKSGEKNLLEVAVSKMSSNKSVNLAERYADYWIFGGIFRPVYLEAYPEEFIERTAIVAKADGTISMDIFPENLKSKRQIYAEIFDTDGKIAGSFSGNAGKTDSLVTLKYKVSNPSLWSSETPAIYKIIVSLRDDEKILYKATEQFGFRTVEIRHGDGIYINGKKIRMKGINRHAFWPETGRSLNRQIDLMDVRLMKEMNMNSVRCSHYPPDKSFLEICDSLGLYVIDELAGWHNAYDTEVGEKLVREMVIRDVNHPSIIFWSNGNEGGTNRELDDDYLKYDPSKRTVIHAHHRPGNAFNGIETNHYESYESTKKILQGSLIYMTTEFLHCMNDGGGGAGLADYWELMRTAPKSGGGYLWALIDEGIVRTDLRGIIDVNGVNAPDGILGPHREKEGSFYTIKEIFTPVYISTQKVTDSFNGEIEIENRFDFTNTGQCTFEWKLIDFMTPLDKMPGYKIKVQGTIPGSNIKPGEKGLIKLDLPADWNKSDALQLNVFDPYKNQVCRRTWKIKSNEALIEKWLLSETNDSVRIREKDSTLTITAKNISVVFDTKNGQISKLRNLKSGRLNFGGGPVLCSGEAKSSGFAHFKDENTYVIEFKYDGNLKYAHWRLHSSGLLELTYKYELKGNYEYTGISFSFPEIHMLSAKWLGNGPYRVWKNRMKGVSYDVWENAYNNTTAGYSPWIYPEFKGYFSDIAWMEFNTVEGKFLVASKENDLFVRLFEFYSLPGIEPHPNLPPGDISFLDRIPPTGSKMGTRINAPKSLGPESQINEVNDTFERTLYFYFGSVRELEEKVQ
ncbi:MAG: glycoside hydrolase family 2 protein [Bacteroidales bacterium]|nr:MAG: glycoside hydrolase family 2 protein [Bacteroidales bacterium]